MSEEPEPGQDEVVVSGLLRELQIGFDIYGDHWREHWSQNMPAEFDLAQNIAKVLITCTRELATPNGPPPIADQLKGELSQVRQHYWRYEAIGALLNQGLLRGPVNTDDLLMLIEQKAEDLARNRGALDAESHDSVQEFFSQSDNPNLRIVWECFVIELAGDALKRIGFGSVRMLKLLQMLVDSNPPERTLGYLRRISACFIWGFDPECIILCRSALDTAFREKISDDIREQEFAASEGREAGLFELIGVAHKRGMISDGIRDIAWRVKNRGNKAVHDDPCAAKDVSGTVLDTMKVLKALFPA